MDLPLRSVVHWQILRSVIGTGGTALACFAILSTEDKRSVNLHMDFVRLRGWQRGGFGAAAQSRTLRSCTLIIA